MATKKKTPSHSRMFPLLHQAVADAMHEHITTLQYHSANTPKGISKQHSTFVMGLFRCYKRTCPKTGWASGKITILIRKYKDGSYNAEVFKQRCKGCNELGVLKMDNESYVDRVAYRLMKWAGVAVERPHYGDKKTKPHRADLCEGCKRGVCGRAEL